jgi:hypothetical protein
MHMQRNSALSALLPSNPKISPHLSSMTAFHAASQRSQAVFPGRKTDFANTASPMPEGVFERVEDDLREQKEKAKREAEKSQGKDGCDESSELASA